MISTLKKRFDTVQLPASFLAVNVSAQHEEDAKRTGDMLQEDDAQVKLPTDDAAEAARPITDE
jgi:hypothetical protein